MVTLRLVAKSAVSIIFWALFMAAYLSVIGVDSASKAVFATAGLLLVYVCGILNANPYRIWR